MNWQPIETAPKDGTLILLATAGLRASDVGFWDGGEFPWIVLDPVQPDFTNAYREEVVDHWMPLPEPPK